MLKKFLWALYAGFIVFSLIQLFSGMVGFTNMKKMNIFKTNLENHVDDLYMKQQKLHDEILRLTDDTERLEISARSLGYVEPGQKMIKILNNKIEKKLYNVDIQYQIPEFERNSNTILLVSAFVTVILFVVSLFVGVIHDTIKRK